MQRRSSGHQRLLLRQRCHLRCHRLVLLGLGVNGVLFSKRFIGHMRPRAGRSPPAVSPYQAIRQEGMHADQLDRIEGKANAQKDDEAERPRSCAARARTKLAQNILHGRPRSATSFCSALAAPFSAVAAALLSARSGRHSFHWALAAGGAPRAHSAAETCRGGNLRKPATVQVIL